MFDYLKKRSLSDKTAWLEVPSIVPGAKLHLRPAAMDNSAYYNASLKLSARRAGGDMPRHIEEKDEMNQARMDDRALFPATVVVGWEGIVDDKGEPVAYSKEVCKDLLDALPDWLFDMVRAFAMNPDRFLQEGDLALPTPEQVQEKAGNSESGSSGS